MASPRRFWAALAIVVACVWASAGIASAVGLPERTHRNTRGDRKPLRYYVLQVLGVGGQVTFEVCGDIEYRERLRDYREEFETAAKEWTKAKADAKRRKEEFKDAPPKGPKLIKKMDGSFKKEEDARAAAEKFQKQWDEAMEKRQAKKEGTAKEEEKKE
ncbi:MAG TPA: hypothetical protein VNE39_10500 [Planctomycetota bacterium]|nr:hypothetical protein [Planctomycetota bacterium]